jgi:putative multiple sugar transport system substrate-binding protein
MRRPAAVALAVALTAGTLSGCAPPDPVHVVAVALPRDDGRWANVVGVLRATLGAAGFTVDVRSADDDIPTQVAQVRDLLKATPDALVVAPVDAGSLTPVLDAAPDRVHVVTLGELVRDTAAVDGYVGFDAAAEGFLQATALLNGLGIDDGSSPQPRGPFRIELFAGSPDDSRTEPAFAGAMAALAPYLDRGTLVIGSGEDSLDEVATLRGNPGTAKSRLTRMLRDTYGTGWPDAVLAPSDQIARALSGTLLQAGAVAGADFPVVTGRGAELRSLVALLDGRQYATLLEDPRALAQEAADSILAALAADPDVLPDPSVAPPGTSIDNGARLVPASLLQPVVVRAGDIDDLVVGSGYWTRARLDAAIAEFGVAPVTPSPTPTAATG